MSAAEELRAECDGYKQAWVDALVEVSDLKEQLKRIRSIVAWAITDADPGVAWLAVQLHPLVQPDAGELMSPAERGAPLEPSG